MPKRSKLIKKGKEIHMKKEHAIPVSNLLKHIEGQLGVHIKNVNDSFNLMKKKLTLNEVRYDPCVCFEDYILNFNVNAANESIIISCVKCGNLIFKEASEAKAN